MIAETVDAALLSEMQTLINSNDETRAGLVRVGKLQQNPVIPVVSILTQANDPDSPDLWPHEIVKAPPTSESIIPAYQIGGGEMWWRRFTTEIQQFWKTDTDRETALKYSSVVLSRAEKTISTTLLGLIDDFGEGAGSVNVIRSKNIEGGGPPRNFIYRGRIWWQVLTEKDY